MNSDVNDERLMQKGPAMNLNRPEDVIRTVELEDFKRDPGATVRRTRDEGPVTVVKEGKTVMTLVIPKVRPLDSTP